MAILHTLVKVTSSGTRYWAAGFKGACSGPLAEGAAAGTIGVFEDAGCAVKELIENIIICKTKDYSFKS
uniref:Uncharacterized protein n=1 Tax=viral metagenome TaxID=1070528 RepID=A0A6C0B797_9ZZZZ